jgi:hypothetical protein
MAEGRKTCSKDSNLVLARALVRQMQTRRCWFLEEAFPPSAVSHAELRMQTAILRFSVSYIKLARVDKSYGPFICDRSYLFVFVLVRTTDC